MAIQEVNIADPFNIFPIEVIENIFKFLNGKDLLIVSEVASHWYEFVGASKECMAKIKVKIACTMMLEILEEEVLPLVLSTRKYENLEISICSHCIETTKAVLESRKGKWKNVTFSRTNFKNSVEALDFLECIESSVEDLRMTEVCTTNPFNDGPNRNFMFPKLKVFHAKYIQVTLFSDAFNNVKNMEEFFLCSHSQTVASLDVIMRLLQVNVSLKILSLSNHIFNQVMYNRNAQDFEFKLKKLIVNSFYFLSEFHDRVQNNFVALLMKQAETLEILEYNDWMGINSTVAAFKLQKLKELTLKGISKALEQVEWEFVDIPKNNSIEKLVIHVPKNYLMFTKLTEAAPKVTNFTTTYIDLYMLMHLAQTHPNLTSLSIGSFDVFEVSGINIFKKLNRLIILQYKVVLEKIILTRPMAQRSFFESKIQELFW